MTSSDAEEDAGQLRVAIIGGGVAGIATCKALSVRGIPCTVFDPQPRVGGHWVAEYPGAAIQAWYTEYAFPDTPFPKPEGCRATAAEVVAYCEEYVREGGLEGCLRLGTRVERVAQRPGGGFTLTTRPAGAPPSGSGNSAAPCSEHFTHAVICTGVFSSVPNMPSAPGLPTFKGKVLHSSQRRDDEAEFRGKRVLIVGGGKSAQDAAVAAQCAGAASVVVAMRTAHLLVPFRMFAVVPYNWIATNRFLQLCMPPFPGQQPRGVLKRLVSAAASPVRVAGRLAVAAVLLMHHRLPARLWPRRGLQEAAGFSGGSMRKVDVRVAEVSKVGPSSVTLRYKPEEGRRAGTEKDIPVDTLVFATGFTGGHPFLDGSIEKALDRQPDGLPLYRHIVPPQLPGFFFVGHAVTLTSPLTSAVQAAWVAEVLRGRLPLPCAAVMRTEGDRAGAALAVAPETPVRRCMLVGQGDRYNEQLARDMGAGRLVVYGGLFGVVGNMVMPQTPADYGDAVRPPGDRTGRSLRPPLWLKAATVAVVAAGVRHVRRA